MKGVTSHAAFPGPRTLPKHHSISGMLTRVTGQDVIYSDQYFRFGQCLTGIVFTLSAAGLNVTTLSSLQHKKCVQQSGYMPLFNSLRQKYGIYPGILVSENQNQTTEVKEFKSMEHLLPIIKCFVPNQITEGKDVIYKLSTAESHVMNIVHRDTRNVLSRVSVSERKALQELDRRYSVTETNLESFLKKDVSIMVRDEEETNMLLPLLPGSSSRLDHEFGRQTDYRRGHQGTEDHRNPQYSKIASVSKSSTSYSLSFSSFKTKSKGGFKMSDISDYEILPQSDGCETTDSRDPLGTKRNEEPRTLTVPAEFFLKYDHAASSSCMNIQESSLSSAEPCPLPEAPNFFLLEPLLLMQQDTADGSRTAIPKKRKGRNEQLTHCEQQKVARIMIGYALAFFLLAIVTFYVVYFV
jgi:hypothetical protein